MKTDFEEKVDKLEHWLEEHPEQLEKWYSDWEKQDESDGSLEVSQGQSLQPFWEW